MKSTQNPSVFSPVAIFEFAGVLRSRFSGWLAFLKKAQEYKGTAHLMRKGDGGQDPLGFVPLGSGFAAPPERWEAWRWRVFLRCASNRQAIV